MTSSSSGCFRCVRRPTPPYQPAIAELLDLPARERPILVAPRQRSGRGVSRRTVTQLAIIALLVVLVGVFTAGSLRNVVVPVPSSSPTASPSVRADLPGAELVDLVGRWTARASPGRCPSVRLCRSLKMNGSGRQLAASFTGASSGSVRQGDSTSWLLRFSSVDEGRLRAGRARIDRYVNAWPAVRGVTVRQLMDGCRVESRPLGTLIEDLARSVASDPQRALACTPMRWRSPPASNHASHQERGTSLPTPRTHCWMRSSRRSRARRRPMRSRLGSSNRSPLEKTFVAGAPIPPPNMPQLNPTVGGSHRGPVWADGIPTGRGPSR